MVDCQNLPTVHLNKTAQRKLGVVDPQLLRPLKGEPLQTKTQTENGAGQISEQETHNQLGIVAVEPDRPYDGCGPPGLL